MKIRSWAVAGLAALLLSGCAGHPEPVITTSSTNPDGTATDDITVLSSGSLVCEFPSESAEARARAEKMVAAEEQFASAMTERVSFAVHDHRFDVSCSRNAGASFETASIIKVATVAAFLRQVEQDPFRESATAEPEFTATPQYQPDAPETDPETPEFTPVFVPAPADLTPAEHDLTSAAITFSDNDSQEELWQLIGGSWGMRAFLAEAGISNTVFDQDEQWGLTMTTAADQLRLIDALVGGQLLSDEHRDYLLELMRNIDPEQVWGVSSGAPEGASVALKNGWLDDPSDVFELPSADEDEQTPTSRPVRVAPDDPEDLDPDNPGDSETDDAEPGDYEPGDAQTDDYEPGDFETDEFDPFATWTNNSIGYVISADESYSLVVLSDGNASDEAGRETVDQVALLVSRTLLG